MKEIAIIRRAAGLTQYALAREAQVPRSKVADVEIGRASFTSEEQVRVVAVLGSAIRKNLEQIAGLLRTEQVVDVCFG